MRTLSLVLLGILLVALIAQSEGAAAKKESKKHKLGQKFEDCLIKAEKADPESDPHQNAEDCKESLTKSGAKGDGDILGGMMEKFEGAISKVKDAFGKVGDKAKDFIDQIKDGLDDLVKGFL